MAHRNRLRPTQSCAVLDKMHTWMLDTRALNDTARRAVSTVERQRDERSAVQAARSELALEAAEHRRTLTVEGRARVPMECDV